ncbi:MAG TPA: ATP-binding protein [Ktedonobacteraceae bacterium]|nr:ATP-binding protein [Ktedonobacteraceae bacterium]
MLQVGLSLTSQHQLLRQLVTLLFIVGALALLLCAVSSYWLAARSLRPVRKVAQTARHIQAGDLHQRVPLPRAHDEIYDLALTFNDMLDSLEQTMLRQQRFVADASHELRTPVAVLRNKASIALLKPQTRQHYETVLQQIITETERLGHLISDLLVLARGDEGRARFERQPIRFDLLTRATVSSAQVLAEERAIQLTVEAETPVTLRGDEARLMQVVMNLVENALSYTDPGGMVQVEVHAQKDGACLLVRDTGRGIAPQHLPHLFERFYRADPSRRQTSGNNSGLGLAIVEWIVRLHGGTITVTSEVGKGSCFCVQLPLHALPPLKEAQRATDDLIQK